MGVVSRTVCLCLCEFVPLCPAERAWLGARLSATVISPIRIGIHVRARVFSVSWLGLAHLRVLGCASVISFR